MASPKCRLEVWKPKIRIVEADGNLLGLYEPERWVPCETHENVATNQRRGNALESTSIADRVFEPMTASMRVTNRPQDFKAYNTDVYKHVYKDSDGVAIPNYPSYPGTLTGGEVYLRKRWGTFTNFFYEFQHVRIVDLETHLVLFAGRITKITKRFEDGNGSIVQLEARDALNDIANITTSALVKSATFGTSHRRSDLVKYMLNLATDYGTKQPSNGPSVDVSIGSGDIATIANSSSGILTTADIGTSDTINQHSRFERSAQPFRSNIKWNAEMTGTKHVLAEIGRWAMLDPHNSNTSERAFGYDLFADANYGKSNLDATIGPGVTGFNIPQFNYFKRGNRLSAAGGAGQDAAVYGLTVKYPIITTASRVGATAVNVGEISESINASVTTFEVVNNGIVAGDQIQIGSEYMYVKQVMPDVEGAGSGDELEVLRGYASTTAASHSVNAVISNPRSAQAVMQRGFNFEDSKEDLYTEAVLTFNAAKDNIDTADEGGVQENNAVRFKQKRLEIMYVTEVAAGSVPDSNTPFHWDGLNIDAERKSAGQLDETAETVDAYNAAGAKQEDDVARIQYQSHATLTGSTNFAFILLSDIKSTFPSSNYGEDTYVELRGSVSGAKCRLNLAAGLTEAHEGRPSKVWGTHRVLDMGQMSDEDATDLRAEIAARLAQATTGLRQGSYAFSKAPYYWWDGLVRSVATATAGVSFGQDITVKNVNGSAAVNITNFGVREGMLVHKMTANHASIAQNGSSQDTYGYIGDMESNTSFAVRLAGRNTSGNTVVSTFSVDDPIRIIIPVRAGTEVFVDNVIAEIYGEHIVSKIEYNEDPMPETRIMSIGKNETRLGGGHRVKGIISSVAQTALAVSEKTKTLQPLSLGSLFGALVVTLPNGSEAHTALKATWSAGKVSMVDGQVFPFAAGSTAVSTYGLNGNMTANQHYIVYLDPEGENLGAGGTYHLYTKRVGAYKRDSDNIPVFHIIATNTAGISKPIIRLQPNIWLNHTEVDGTIPLTNEAGATIDIASIKTELIADLAIDTAQLAANAVERAKIDDGAINASKIEAGTITATEIEAGTITATEIATGTITTGQLNFSPNTDSTSSIQAGTTKANVGLSNVDNDSTASIRAVAAATSGSIGSDSPGPVTLAGLKVAASTFYIGTGTFSHSNTPFFVRGVDGGGGTAGDFSLGDKLIWDDSASTLTIDGDGTFSGSISGASGTFTGTVTAGGFSIGGSGGAMITNSSTDSDFEATSFLKLQVGSDMKGYIRCFSSPDDMVMIGTKDGGTIRLGSPPGGGGGNSNNVNTEAIQMFCSYLGLQSGDNNTRQYWIAPGGASQGDVLTASLVGTATIAGESSQPYVQLGWAAGGGGSGDITAVLAGDGIAVSGGSSGDATVSVAQSFDPVWTGDHQWTGATTFKNGSASAPGIKFVGDGSTVSGIFFEVDGSNRIRFPTKGGSGAYFYQTSSSGSGLVAGTGNFTSLYATGTVTFSGTTTHSSTTYLNYATVMSGIFTQTGNTLFSSGDVTATSAAIKFTGLGGGSNTTNYLAIDSNGLIWKYTSSARYKDNIRSLEVDSTQIYNFVPKSFEFKADGGTAFGYIAEEVETILPAVVMKQDDGTPEAIDYPLLSVLLIEELKKLRARIEVLEGD